VYYNSLNALFKISPQGMESCNLVSDALFSLNVYNTFATIIMPPLQTIFSIKYCLITSPSKGILFLFAESDLDHGLDTLIAFYFMIIL